MSSHTPLSDAEEARVRAGYCLDAWLESDDYQRPDGDYGRWLVARVWATLDAVRAASTTAALEVQQPDRDDVDPETIIRMHLDGRPPRKYVPVDGVELREIVGAAVARATEALTTAEWDDRPLPEDGAISAAFPTRSGKHAVYGEAMRMVGACQSKGRLVRLVNWLLVRIDEREGR